ncbi:MAG TPA: CHAP domain-containing protein [Myxococcaceae bacterium]|nr:CHAP domain-containing protein [Myxococcaceae bacterium]
MLRKLLLSLMLTVLGAAPAGAASRGAVRPEVQSRKSSSATGRRKPTANASRGARVARRAGALVGSSLRGYRSVPDDCSGVVRLAYREVGVELLSQGMRPGENAVTAMYRRAKRAGALHKRTPRPGDLVFFRETYDRNGDGRRNDGLTHVGVVERVEKDGTVVFVHRTSRGVKRGRMNLRHPKLHQTRDGSVLNDYLRRAERGQRARFTGELFSGYATSSRL